MTAPQSLIKGIIYNDMEIYLDNGITVTKLTDNDLHDQFAQINNNGYIVWQTDTATSLTELFLYNGSTTIQLTNNKYFYYFSPKINNNGYVVWYGYDPTSNYPENGFFQDRLISNYFGKKGGGLTTLPFGWIVNTCWSILIRVLFLKC